MNKSIVLTAALLLSLVSDAYAGFLDVSWYGVGLYKTRGAFISSTNPEMYGLTVYDMGTRVGPGWPPIKGGTCVVLDITDRTHSQVKKLTTLYLTPLGLDYRYAIMITKLPPKLYQDFYQRGFLVTKWDEIKYYIWDKKFRQTLAGTNWRYAEGDKHSVTNGELRDDCFDNCDYEACVASNSENAIVGWCDCEDYMGRRFCHKKQGMFVRYSPFNDRERLPPDPTVYGLPPVPMTSSEDIR